ncbi:glycoprotein-N-acetylgalactosamine 3-beta-galactosyltransferase 1-like isoform X2 [Diorhabda carinulata]|uniref:glycoprotein-N-acetylgalactosamine 3-beta-galactosyltransferase 1-like isoform X2 n=1 Tax=Diorhabda carinulata TaxID=1163345 RepID=UPI0025A11138|nr:glycoprotein-N-acetylgalactosamine 3-beta-galactosyltransferase 1-like isoform X2 [Diorhabda carinulata]XP_057658310.1 glycoprotein-N-acetylgalactosamine 3-beta-galactosyltransferase 1-like isoform X2 [Diorhabda carinulata]
MRTVENKTTFCLITGIVIGFTLAFIVLAPSTVYRPANEYSKMYKSGTLKKYDNEPPPIDNHGHRDNHHDFHNEDELDDVEDVGDVGQHGDNDTFHKMTDSSLAEALKEKVRILCWVMTGPSNHDTKAKHVKATWGKRCNILLFMSSQADPNLPAIPLNVSEGRDNLWAKTKAAYRYVYENYFDQADWFMKADDDTYVIVENLRYMLLSVNPDMPIYYGCRFKPYVKQGYMSGGAGYILSREAVRRFIELGLPNKNKCRQDNNGAEDVEMGKCLESVDVIAGDSRDPENRGRFFPFSPEHHLIPGHVDKSFWYWSYIYYNETPGLECCSDNAISFHYIRPNMMYAMEYLIYHLKPFGIAYNPVLPDELKGFIARQKDEKKINQRKKQQKQ